MAESPQQWYDRVRSALESDGYRYTQLARWSSWPWTGELTPKPLDPPADVEPDRHGAGGVGCHTCEASVTLDPGYVVWHDDSWMLGLPFEPRALPFALFLMPRRHADLQNLTPAEAARQGEHLHWWLYARPTGMLQLRGTFLSHWDDLLPPVPTDLFRADQLLVVEELVRRAGGRATG